eukprot:TRINITY_DN7530_c0_g1_i3.p1 TRINITY_DN7530_c0_g1~~TRINITY_DN7530_c0_g1_i3.p1  ORF type:complete len:248 (+),score=102.34 TRINITY_DN7530_c0_g1_i3:153-896(+)
MSKRQWEENASEDEISEEWKKQRLAYDIEDMSDSILSLDNLSENFGNEFDFLKKNEEKSKINTVEDAILKFKMVSCEEIQKISKNLKEKGEGSPSPLQIILNRIRGGTKTKKPSQVEVKAMMLIGNFDNEEDAIRSIIFYEEIVQLREEGLGLLEAVEELTLRVEGISKEKPKQLNDNSLIPSPFEINLDSSLANNVNNDEIYSNYSIQSEEEIVPQTPSKKKEARKGDNLSLSSFESSFKKVKVEP